MSRPRRKPLTRLILSLIALLLLAIPAGIVWRDLQSWDKAISVTGIVIGISPEGPFPDVVTVQYQDQNGQAQQVDISTNYATARKIGDQVDLVYQPETPARGMTRIQRRDEGWSVSPYLLFISVGASSFCLCMAFPEYLRFGRKGKR